MSKYSELADKLLRWPSVYTIGTGLHEDLSAAAAALRELEAENRMYSESLANATQEIERLREALQALHDAEWMMSHDWGGDREAVLAVARAALEGK